MLDTGGPLTVTALKNGQVDAADLFTTDPAIKANNFVVLTDPKSNFGAQNVLPLINKSKATAGVKQVLNRSRQAHHDGLIDLRTKVEVNDRRTPTRRARTARHRPADTPGRRPGRQPDRRLGQLPGERHPRRHLRRGAQRRRRRRSSSTLNIGSREKYIPALKDGSIDLIPEYSGVLLQYFDKTATATTPDDVYAALQKAVPGS